MLVKYYFGAEPKFAFDRDQIPLKAFNIYSDNTKMYNFLVNNLKPNNIFSVEINYHCCQHECVIVYSIPIEVQEVMPSFDY